MEFLSTFFFLIQDKAVYADDFGDSDNEVEPDAYLARVKAEGKARDSDDDDDGSNSDESTDDDFNPDAGKLNHLPFISFHFFLYIYQHIECEFYISKYSPKNK